MQFCRGRGRGQGIEVEAEARQGSNVLNRGKAEAESSRPRRGGLNSRSRRGRVKSTLFVSFWYAQCTCTVVVTCSCFVVNDIYQWKTLQRSFIKKVYQIPDRAKTEAETMRQSQGRGSKVKTVWDRGEAEPAKKLPRAEADASRTTSLICGPCNS